jgi:anti-sigma factor RsiW
MKPIDEQIMAYVDGELNPADRARIESLLASDPNVARLIEQQRRLRARLRSAFDPVLLEAVPSRLVTALRREIRPAPPRTFAIAASTVLGIALGAALWQFDRNRLYVTDGDRTVATGALARALQHDLSGTPGRALRRASIGATFLAADGGYCRVFAVTGSDQGVACHEGGRWVVHAIDAAHARDPVANGYRPAQTPFGPRTLAVVESRMVGEVLDSAAEAAARASGWQAQ